MSLEIECGNKRIVLIQRRGRPFWPDSDNDIRRVASMEGDNIDKKGESFCDPINFIKKGRQGQKEIKENFFRKVYVNINYSCNYKCKNCILNTEQRIESNNPLLSITDLKEAMRKLLPLIQDGVNNICEISGGEPTIHPQFSEICHYLAQLRDESIFYKLALLTNAHILSEKQNAEKVSSFVDDVVITIYTSDAEQHDRVTGVKNSLKRKLKAIENLISLGVQVHIKTLIMKPSYQFIPGIAKKVCSIFKESIHLTFNTTHFIGDAKTNNEQLGVRLTDAAPYVEEAIDIAISSGSSIGLFFPLCLIDPIYWEYASVDYADQVKRTYAITPSSKAFNRAKDLEKEFVERHEVCISCPLRIRCSWPWQSYTEIFGDSEIIIGRQELILKQRR